MLMASFTLNLPSKTFTVSKFCFIIQKLIDENSVLNLFPSGTMENPGPRPATSTSYPRIKIFLYTGVRWVHACVEQHIENLELSTFFLLIVKLLIFYFIVSIVSVSRKGCVKHWEILICMQCFKGHVNAYTIRIRMMLFHYPAKEISKISEVG